MTTFVVHRGSFATDVQYYPEVTSYNIAQDWSGNGGEEHNAVNQLRTAVGQLVDANPILSGIFHWGNNDNDTNKNHLLITTGYYSSNDLFVEIPAPSPTAAAGTEDDAILPSPRTINPKHFKTYLDEHIVPLLPPIRTTKECLVNKLPVFGVFIIRLPDNYLFYSIRISHALADTTTYSLIVQQLANQMAMENESTKEKAKGKQKQDSFIINWNLPFKETFEPLGHLQNPWFLASAVLGTIRYYIFHLLIKPLPQPTFLLLSRTKIQEQKQKLCNHNLHAYLSSTDIIVAAMAQAFGHAHPYFVLWMSLRKGRHPAIPNYNNNNNSDDDEKHQQQQQEVAGNLMKDVVLLSKDVAGDPNAVRQIVQKKAAAMSKASVSSSNDNNDNNNYYPYRQALQSRACFVSSWLGITSVLPNTICRVLPVELAQDGPVALMAIFDYNDEYIAVYHTADMDLSRSRLLAEILVEQ